MEEVLFGYDESLDSPLIDEDPNFREVLRLLNSSGVHTVSSCQGHAPGTQYEDVQVWMDPYITCTVDEGNAGHTKRLLRAIGARLQRDVPNGKIHAKFPRRWDWKRSLAVLKASLPQK
jgi:hypothetical protein